MCIAFFESHPENQRQHYALHYHCAHEECDGRFESHHRFLLDSAYGDCSHCLQKDGVEIDPDVNPVAYYPPIDDSGLQFVPSKSWERVAKNVNEGAVQQWLATGAYGEESEKDKVDVDTLTYDWRVEAQSEPRDPTQHPSPVLMVTGPENIICPSSTLRGPHNQHQATHQPFAGRVPSVQPSPNTTMHRDLVNEQLARLPRHISHAQQQFQPMCWYPRQDCVAPQRKSSNRGGPQGYSKRTPSDLWQCFKLEQGHRF